MGLILVKKYVFLYFGANLTENDPRTPIFLFHFWNPDNFSNLYVKFEENLMDFKNEIKKNGGTGVVFCQIGSEV